MSALLRLAAFLVGVSLVVAGVWLVYVPAALVAAGLILTVTAWSLERATQTKPPREGG